MRKSPRTAAVFVAAIGVAAGDGCHPPADTRPPAATPRLPVTIEGVEFQRARFSEWSSEQRRVGFRNVEKLRSTRTVQRGRNVSSLRRQPIDLSRFTYSWQGRQQTIDDFMKQMNVAGLLILKNDRIVFERYAQGHTEKSAWTSFSVAKSVVSMLFGAAIADGSIRSLDDTLTRYVPRLRGSAYDAVTVRQLLQMSTGVEWNEDYEDPNADLYRMPSRLGSDSVLAYLKHMPRKAPPGTRFNYNSGEIDLAGIVLTSATGRPLAEYLSERIWRPAGMESNAYWMTLREGDVEYADCCLSATLRDYGRLGLLALHDGVTANGNRVLPRGWMNTSTTPASTNPEYGFLWWLRPAPDHSFMAVGIYGQNIYIDPARKLVIAIQSFWDRPNPEVNRMHRAAFRQALADTVAQTRATM